MFIPFDSLPPSSRVWVYQAGEKLTPDQITITERRLKLLTEGWVAHGEPLRSSFAVMYDQFVVLAADEEYHAASGCSIDDAFRQIQILASELRVDLFDRNKVAFLIDGKVTLVSLASLRQQYEAGLWNEQTPTFNNLVETKGKLESEWIRPAGATWLNRFATGLAVK